MTLCAVLLLLSFDYIHNTVSVIESRETYIPHAVGCMNIMLACMYFC
jgi:hypothetical protein